MLFALLGCCCFLSQAQRSPPPSRSLTVRALSTYPCLSLFHAAPHDPISPKIQHTPRPARWLGRTAPAPRIIASNYFWFRFQPWWGNVVNPLREITRESKRVNNNSVHQSFCYCRTTNYFYYNVFRFSFSRTSREKERSKSRPSSSTFRA